MNVCQQNFSIPNTGQALNCCGRHIEFTTLHEMGNVTTELWAQVDLLKAVLGSFFALSPVAPYIDRAFNCFHSIPL